MTSRRAGLLLAVLPLLAGCPIDQPLPTVAGGATLPPPRIVFERLSPQDTVVPVSKICTAPLFPLTAEVADENREEVVEARWFVDYASPGNTGVAASESVDPSPDPSNIYRPLTAFYFAPLDYGPTTGPPHVVELVASNRFWAQGTPGLPLPNRTPLTGYETQVFRWVFVWVDPPAGRCQ